MKIWFSKKQTNYKSNIGYVGFFIAYLLAGWKPYYAYSGVSIGIVCLDHALVATWNDRKAEKYTVNTFCL